MNTLIHKIYSSFLDSKSKCILYSLLPFFLGLFCYINNYQNTFIWDDEFLIQKNEFIRSFHDIPRFFYASSTAGSGGNDNFYRPMQTVFYTVIYNTLGPEPWGFHFGNNLIHSFNGLLLFWLLMLLTQNAVISLSTALLWVSHPVHTEAVTYISGTADPLSVFFILISLILFFKNKFFFSNLAFVLALLSKESVVVYFLILFPLVIAKNNFKLEFKKFLVILPFAATSFIYLIFRKTILNFDGTFDFYKEQNIYTENLHFRLFTFLAALKEYFYTLFYPLNLHMERNFPVYTTITSQDVLLGGGLLLFLFLIMYLSYRRKSLTGLISPYWFLCFFIPMCGILIPVNSFFLEHWLYLTSIGFFILLSVALNKLAIKKSSLNLFVLIPIVSALSYLTLERNTVWQDPITFYTDILKYNQNSARIHNNIAMAYSDLKQHQMAIEHYLKAISVSDVYHQTHYNLARQYIEIEDYPKAMFHLDRSLSINPNFPQAIDVKNQLLKYIQSTSK